MVAYDVASNICQGLYKPSFLSSMVAYDVASSICQAVPPMRLATGMTVRRRAAVSTRSNL